jgi:hypothetical protein
MAKIGRNMRCPCGSGRKYKHCHGGLGALRGPHGNDFADQIRLGKARAEAARIERELQHGRGRPPLSAVLNETRFVGVGSTVFFGKDWKTFPDFLMHYYKHVLGEAWWTTEVGKPAEARHPLYRWYVLTCVYQAQHIRVPGRVVQSKATGAMLGVMWLAYGLYLLEHNVEVQKRLLGRLRDADPVQIFGAVYEVWIAAAMLWAGFDLALEDENDRRRTHCEFTATSKLSGRKFSVEAKVCDPGNLSTGSTDRALRKQLARALRKEADHERIVFIDLNEPALPEGVTPDQWFQGRVAAMRREEWILKAAPAANVFLTNYPYRYTLESLDVTRFVFLEGFKISKLKHDAQFASLREAGDFLEANDDLYRLVGALAKMEVPNTFDGTAASRAFTRPGERLLVGECYVVPGPDGRPVVGRMTQGLVMDRAAEAAAVLELGDGRNLIYKMPLTPAEIETYRASPETFFGVPQHVGKQIDNPLDLYLWMLSVYRKTPKSRLLELLQGHPKQSQLLDLPQDELAKILCEGYVHSTIARTSG